MGDNWDECDPVAGKPTCDYCKIEPVKCVDCHKVMGCHLKPTPLRCDACRLRLIDPPRCYCGAYAWPKNMMGEGHIGDAASVHTLLRCWPRGAGEIPQKNHFDLMMCIVHLNEILYALQSNEADSKVSREAVEWRKRVVATVKRNLAPVKET